MLARIIFCVAVAAAVLAVVLLATVSPLPHSSGAGGGGGGHRGATGQRSFTVYVHPTGSAAVQAQQQGKEVVRRGEASALVFHHRMTAGPEITSRTVGAASGFLLLSAGERGPAAASVFDTVHLSFDGAAGLSGSLCVEASASRRPGKRRHDADEEVLQVVGGTGAFAFARGHAVFRRQRPGHGVTAAALLLEISVSCAES